MRLLTARLAPFSRTSRRLGLPVLVALLALLPTSVPAQGTPCPEPAIGRMDMLIILETSGGQISSGAVLQDALFFSGVDPVVVEAPTDITTDPCVLAHLDNIHRLWVVCGTFPESRNLTATERDFLADYLGGDYRFLYLESGDHWGFEYVPSALDAHDGIASAIDGDDSLTQLDGNAASAWSSGLAAMQDVPYAQDSAGDDRNDRFTLDASDPNLEVEAFFTNSPDAPGETADPVAVFSASLLADSIMISSSFEFGGVQTNAFPLYEAYVEPLPIVEFGFDWLSGDCNKDAQIDIADAIRVLQRIFPGPGGPPTGCEKACDANEDGNANIADAITILTSLFQTFTTPPPNFGACLFEFGDPTPFDCEVFGCP